MKHSPRNGFNLIEAAIVLAVVGLVLGGIWIAASAVQQTNMVNRMVGGILHIDQQAKTLIPQSMLAPASDTSFPYDMGLFPKDWTVSGTDYYAPNGMRVGASILTGSSSLRLYMAGGEMDAAQCIKFTTAIMRAMGMKGVAMAYAPSGYTVGNNDPSTQTLSYITRSCSVDTDGYIYALSIYLPLGS